MDSPIDLQMLNKVWHEECVTFQRKHAAFWKLDGGIFAWTDYQKQMLLEVKKDIEEGDAMSGTATSSKELLAQYIQQIDKGEKLIKQSAWMRKHTCVLRGRKTHAELPQARWNDELLPFLKELYQYSPDSLAHRKWQLLHHEIRHSSSVDLELSTMVSDFQDAIEISWRKLKQGKAPGADGLTSGCVRIFHRGTRTFQEFSSLAWKLFCDGDRREIFKRVLTQMIPKNSAAVYVFLHRMISLQPIFNKWYRAALTVLLTQRTGQCKSLVFRGTPGIRGADFIDSIKGIIAAHQETVTPLALLKLDLRKKFDNISLISLAKVLLRRSHGDTIAIRLLQEALEVIIVADTNGKGNVELEAERGIRQGGPDSMVLFNLCVNEILAMVQQEQISRGWIIKMPKTAVPIHPFAWVDDWILAARTRIILQKRMERTAALLWSEMELEIAPDKIEWMTKDQVPAGNSPPCRK